MNYLIALSPISKPPSLLRSRGVQQVKIRKKWCLISSLKVEEIQLAIAMPAPTIAMRIDTPIAAHGPGLRPEDDEDDDDGVGDESLPVDDAVGTLLVSLVVVVVVVEDDGEVVDEVLVVLTGPTFSVAARTKEDVAQSRISARSSLKSYFAAKGCVVGLQVGQRHQGIRQMKCAKTDCYGALPAYLSIQASSSRPSSVIERCRSGQCAGSRTISNSRCKVRSCNTRNAVAAGDGVRYKAHISVYRTRHCRTDKNVVTRDLL